MPDHSDLNSVEALVSRLLNTLKEQVTRATGEGEEGGFFPDGINHVSVKIGDRDLTLQLDISGAASGSASGKGDGRTDRFIRPMYVVYPAVSGDTVKSVNVTINVIYSNGTTGAFTLPNLPHGTTTVDLGA